METVNRGCIPIATRETLAWIPRCFLTFYRTFTIFIV